MHGSSRWFGRVALGIAVSLVFATLPADSSAYGRFTMAGDTDSEAAETQIEVSRVEVERDASAELTEAVATGEPVEVLWARTEDSETFANPDGTLTTHLYAGPVRVRDGDGWREVDTTLIADGSGVRPVTATADIRFSPGGLGELVSLGNGGRRIGFVWPGRLPAPELEGSVATYRDILPGIDLELEALPHGYLKRFVVRERPDEPLVLRIPVSLVGLRLFTEDDGSLRLTDLEDRVVARGDAPWMWGAGWDTRWDEPLRHMAVEYRLTETEWGGVIELRPDPAFLADPDVQLPIVIDPSSNLTATADTYVQSNSTVSKWTDVELKAGTYDGGTTKARSLIRFNTSTLAGTHILSASLYLWEKHSWSCSARQVNVYKVTSDWGSSTVWSNQPTISGTLYGSLNVAVGYSSSCPAAWIAIPVTSLVQEWANGVTNYGLSVRAASETDSYGWKKFDSADTTRKPYLAVTYNSYPYVANPSPPHGAFTTSLKPTLTATFADPDGGTGTLFFEIATTGGTLVASGSKTGIASWSSGSWAPGSNLTSETTYKWRVRAYDGIDYSSWSSYYEIKVDATAPAAPTVSSSTHPSESTWYPSRNPSLSWSASDWSGINGYSYVLDQVSSTIPDTISEGTATSRSYSNLADGIWYFHIRARDGAGNWGATRHRTIRIDATPSPASTISSSTHPDQDRWYTPEDGPGFNDPSFTWTPVSDISGVTGYSYLLDQNPTGVPNDTVDTTGTSASFSDVGGGASGVFWFHVKARNGAGLWGPVAHYRVQIDAGTAAMTEPGHETTLQGQVTLRATTGPNAIGVRFEYWTGVQWLSLGTGTQSPATVWSLTWNTAALDGSGQRVYPNGPYQLRAVPLFTGGEGNPVVGAVVTVDDTRLGTNPWWSFLDLGAGAQVNVATGNLVVSATDAELATVSGTLGFVRTYNSQGSARDGLLGWGWEFAFPSEGAPAAFTTLTRHTGDGDYVEILDVTGESLYFLRDEDGAWLPEAGAEAMTLDLIAGVWVVTDIDGTTYRFADAGANMAGNLLEARPPTGSGVSYGYDAQGRLVSVTDPTGHKTFTLEYGANGRLARIRAGFDAGIIVAEYGYDAAGHLITVTDPRTGLATTYAYTGHLLTAITPPGLTPIGFSYQASPTGRLAAASRALPGGGNAVTSLAYGSWDEGAQTTVTTPRSHLWVYRFDLSSRPRHVIPPLGPATESRWNAHNRATYTQSTAEAAAGMATVSTFSSEDHPCNLSGAEGANDGTDLCAVTRPQLGTVAYEYDEALGAVHHLVTRQINADGSYLRYEYDADGLAAKRPNRELTYSAAGVLLETRAFTYDTWGRVVSETAPGGQVTTFSYYPTSDPVRGGLLASLSRPGAPTRSYDYNLWGRVISEAWPLGATVTVYDGAQRVISQTAAGEPTVTTSYDPVTGLVASVGDVSGTVSYVYDAWGRVVSYTDATGAVTTTSYDADSNPLTVTTAVGTIGYGYDALGRVVEITDAVGVTTVSYRSDGTYDTVTLPNGVTASYTARPGAGDLATLTYSNASGVLGVFERDYNTRGRVITDTSPEGTRAYTYDGLGRLVSVVDKDPGGGVVETRDYGFDANTNRITFTVTPATGSPTIVSYSYDTADRLIEVTGGASPGLFGYDGNGNTVSMPGVSLTWTGDNRIASIATASATVAYGYDALGRTRTRSDGTTTSLYHYGGDGDAPAWVQDGTTTTRYVPGPAGLSAAHVIGGDVVWLLATPHGALWAHTDGLGDITAMFFFDEYGVPRSPGTGDLGLDRYGWLGRQQRETDPGSGLILMGVRVYAPTLGRFLSVDPIHGGNATAYDYCYGDPVNCYDLDGRWAFVLALPFVAPVVATVAVAIAATAVTVWAIDTGVKLMEARVRQSSGGTARTRGEAVNRARETVRGGRSGCNLRLRYECNWMRPGPHRKQPHVHVDVYRGGRLIEKIHYYWRQ